MPVDAPVKLSVIVPVYNPGRQIEPLIESLRRQSMPADEFEAVFVDDGSTDSTPARLDALAAATPNVRVVHQPNSGWPGKPRNVGIEMARGDYLFFADNDDYLAPEALERMYAYATDNGSDVVVPKLVGHDGRGVPWELFRRNRPRARLGRDPLLTILTPHKLFRRSMVLEHGIRFPEGRVRLEDHYFVMKAFFAARVISVLADYTCYHWTRREVGTNATYLPVEPEVYYDSVRAVLDVVEENTEPGELRDRLYAHWYHSKILRRLCGWSMAAADPDYRRRTFDEVRRLTLDRFGDGVDRNLVARDRAQSALLRAGSYEPFFALADAERGVTIDTMVQRLDWEDGQLVLGLSATLVYADGSPVLFRSDGEHVSWVLPRIDAAEVPLSALDVTAQTRGAHADVAVRDRDSHVRHFVPTEFERVPWRPGIPGPLRFRLEAVIDPATAAGGAALGETTDLLVRIAGCGWGPFIRPSMADVPVTESRTEGWDYCAYGTEGYNRISIRKRRSTAEPGSPDMAKTSKAHAADEVQSWARRSGDHVHLVLRLPDVDLERGTEPTIELKHGGTTTSTPASVTSTAEGTTLTADPSAVDLGTGTWRLALRLPGDDVRERIDARLLLPERGPIALLTGPPPGRSLRPRPRGGSLARRAVRTVGTATDAVLRELPPGQAVRYRAALRRVARTVRR